MTHTKTTKKSQGDESTNSKNFHKDNNNLIVEQPGKPRCPVASFEKYLATLDHSLDLLFQQPKKKKNHTSQVYQNMVPQKSHWERNNQGGHVQV